MRQGAGRWGHPEGSTGSMSRNEGEGGVTAPLCIGGIEAHVAAVLMERAAHVVRAQGDIPDHAAGVIGTLALIVIQIIKSSPGDQAEQVELLARMMRR